MTNWVEIEHVDALPVRGTTLTDLDMERIVRHVQRARTVDMIDPIAYLRDRQGVVAVDNVLVPTLGGLLCFGTAPQRYLPMSGIAITRYTGNVAHSQQVIDIRDLTGSLFDLIDAAESYLWTQSNHGFRLVDSPRRVPLDQYPKTVLRELIVNALAHRDYRVTGSRVNIQLFKNEIEWSSPGGLPPGITVENILKSQYTRNPVLVGFLFDAGYIEQRGMGLDTVVHILQDEQLRYPLMEDTRASFLIRIEGHGSVDKQTAHNLSAQVAQVFEVVERAGSGGISSRELSALLNIPIRTINERIKSLIVQKLIVRTGATSNIRYYVYNPDA
ncbi:MAG: hypothetical protein H7Z42_14685 [Roseiflexaceae bacterium]|nr:hypothetical protein [Roseiflexaceae bacterium]